jgi:hypothetical protein
MWKSSSPAGRVNLPQVWRCCLLALVLGACGATQTQAQRLPDAGGNGVPIVPEGVEPIESFEADKIAALCAAEVRCHQVATADGCIAATLSIFSPQLVPDVQSGTISYDPSLGYRCIELTLAASCQNKADLESCHDAFTGTLPGGASCTFNAECTSDVCSMTGCTSGCCPPGICADGVEVRDVPAGGSCAPGGGLIECGEGEYCLESSGVCQARAGLGGTCDNICQQDLVCSLGATDSRTCVVAAAAGASCVDVPCDADSFCATPGSICAPVPKPGDGCTESGTCGLALNCVGGVCVTPGALGEPCVGANGSIQCQSGITYLASEAVTCSQGVCVQQEPMPAGIDCLSP